MPERTRRLESHSISSRPVRHTVLSDERALSPRSTRPESSHHEIHLPIRLVSFGPRGLGAPVRRVALEHMAVMEQWIEHRTDCRDISPAAYPIPLGGSTRDLTRNRATRWKERTWFRLSTFGHVSNFSLPG